MSVTDKDGIVRTCQGAAVVGSVCAGATASFVATPFTNVPGGTPANCTATVTWGDGTTSNGTVSGQQGNLAVSASHVYTAEATRSVSVTINCTNGNSQNASTSVGVEPGPVQLYFDPVHATVTQSFSTSVAAFADANPYRTAISYQPALTWTAGTDTALPTIFGAAGLFSVLASHSYPEAGLFGLSITLGIAGTSLTGTAGPTVVGRGQSSPSLAGPTAAPSLSQYQYQLLSPGNGKITGLTWTSDDATAKLQSQDDPNLSAVFAFGDSAKVVTLKAAYKLNGTPQEVKLNVGVVQVIIKDSSFSRSEGARVKDSSGKYPYRVKNPSVHYDWYRPPGDSKEFWDRYIASVNPGRDPQASEDNLVLQSGTVFGNNTPAFAANVTVGVVAPVDKAGRSHPEYLPYITVGIIQLALQPSGKATYTQPTRTLHSYVDAAVDWYSPGALNNVWPFYNNSVWFQYSADQPNTTQRLLPFADSPSVIFPTLLNPPAGHNFGLTSLTYKLPFRLHIGAFTYSQPTPMNHFNEGALTWDMTFSYNVNAINQDARVRYDTSWKRPASAEDIKYVRTVPAVYAAGYRYQTWD